MLLLQVCNLAGKLLEVTSYLEEVSSNVRSLSSLLRMIAKKILLNGTVEGTDRQTIEMTEDLLHQNIFKDTRISALLQQLQPNTDSVTCDDVKSKAWQFDFEQGLDEAHDLDWDTEGMELSYSTMNSKETVPVSFSNSFIHSPVSEANKLSPLDSIGRVIEETDVDVEGEVGIPKSSSYQGVYEEAMEMSLELEEGFYSDMEDNDDIVQLKLPTSSTSLHASKFSIYEMDEMKAQPTSPCNYHLVSLEDDLRSVYSDTSVHNSPRHNHKHSHHSSLNLSTKIDTANEQSEETTRAYVNPRIIAEEVALMVKNKALTQSLEIKSTQPSHRRRYKSETLVDSRRLELEFDSGNASSKRRSVFAKMSPHLHHRNNFMSRRLPVFV